MASQPQNRVRDVTDAYLVREQLLMASMAGSSEDELVEQGNNEATALICKALIDMGF